MARKLTLITKQNRKIRRKQFFKRFLTLTVLVGIMVTTGYFMYTERLTKLSEAKALLAEYEEQYSELPEKEEYYRDEISKLENEDYIAQLAREKYFKSEEGEIIFKLPEDSQESNEN